MSALKPHEEKILSHFVGGLDPSAIARKLDLDKHYVANALSRIRKKTKLNSQQLVLVYSKSKEDKC